MEQDARLMLSLEKTKYFLDEGRHDLSRPAQTDNEAEEETEQP